MRIYINGGICEGSEAVVSVYDHGFLYGMGLFETFRTYHGAAFLLEEHLDRLAQGCSELGIDYETDPSEVKEIIRRLLDANGLTDGYFRLTVSAGVDILGLPAQSYNKPTCIVYVKELPAAGIDHGKSLQLLHVRRNTPEGTLRRKSLHYMNNILAKREMQHYPWSSGAEGLFLSEDGFVAEGIVSNVFFASGGVCYTPSLDTGILPGITRDWVIRMASKLGAELREGHYTWDDLCRADEVFVTNSIQEIVPVTRLFDREGNSREPGNGQTGRLTRLLMEQYRRMTDGGRDD